MAQPLICQETGRWHWSSQSSSINDTGQVVGRAQTSSGSTHAFSWENGVINDLGTLGGMSSQAWSNNDSGQVVGVAQRTDGILHAALWDSENIYDLRTLGGGL